MNSGDQRPDDLSQAMRQEKIYLLSEIERRLIHAGLSQLATNAIETGETPTLGLDFAGLDDVVKFVQACDDLAEAFKGGRRQE